VRVFDLELPDHCYYIKRSTIVEKIHFRHRTFYAKFERIDEPLTPLLLDQHLRREYTIAVPLILDGHTDYLVLEYRGTDPLRFYHLSRHLMETLQIRDYHHYQGKRAHYVQLFIAVAHLCIKEADALLQRISDDLTLKMPRAWKCFPDPSLPKSYQIITLPFKRFCA
jgi:hypothetical protein